jgi:hypothetical protein
MSNDRVAFARYLTLVLTITTRAIDQALDPDLPELRGEDARNYTERVRKHLDEIDRAVEEAD